MLRRQLGQQHIPLPVGEQMVPQMAHQLHLLGRTVGGRPVVAEDLDRGVPPPFVVLARWFVCGTLFALVPIRAFVSLG